MRLRKLEIKDGFYMKEWMNDPNIMACFRMDKAVNNDEKILDFISHSFTEENRHYGIVDEKDEYQGTISLKNIDLINWNAEYAVVLRKGAISKGIAREATGLLLNVAFEELQLHKVYLNVLENNIRAIKFYEKMSFQLEGEFKEHVYLNEKYYSLLWYAITKKKFINIEDCKIKKE